MAKAELFPACAQGAARLDLVLQGLWGESSCALCHGVAAWVQNCLELVGGITGREREVLWWCLIKCGKWMFKGIKGGGYVAAPGLSLSVLTEPHVTLSWKRGLHPVGTEVKVPGPGMGSQGLHVWSGSSLEWGCVTWRVSWIRQQVGQGAGSQVKSCSRSGLDTSMDELSLSAQSPQQPLVVTSWRGRGRVLVPFGNAGSALLLLAQGAMNLQWPHLHGLSPYH